MIVALIIVLLGSTPTFMDPANSRYVPVVSRVIYIIQAPTEID